MNKDLPKYHFRRRDYAKIRSWFEFTKQHYVPSISSGPSQRQKEWHYRFQFKTLTLSQNYVNNNIKKLLKIKKLIILTNLLNTESQYWISSGQEVAVQCEFDINNLTLTLKENIFFFFYLETKSPKDYVWSIEWQMIDQEGQLSRFGSSRFPLQIRKDVSKEGVLLVAQRVFEGKKMEQMQTLSQVQYARSGHQGGLLQGEGNVAFLQYELDLQQIKQIRKYLPSGRIIDKNTKIAPTKCDIRRKKDPFIVQPPNHLKLKSLMFKISNPLLLKKQLLRANPFTLSHQELINFNIKSFRMILDNHNGWKWLRQGKNEFKMQLVVDNEEQIYVSTKTTQDIPVGCYDAEGVLLVVGLVCRVQFQLKGVVGQIREEDYLLGWLPLPIDLSLQEHSINLMLINDIQLPLSSSSSVALSSLFDIPCHFTASFLHPLFSKFKSKHPTEEPRQYAEQLLQQEPALMTHKYLKLTSAKQLQTQTTDSNEIIEGLDQQIKSVIDNVAQGERKNKEERKVKVLGRAGVIQQRIENTPLLPLESTVGKTIKVSLQLLSLLPETLNSSDYYLPRKMKATVYFMRSSHSFSLLIADKECRFSIPVRLSAHRLTFSFNLSISTLQEYHSLLASRFVIALHQQDHNLYAKGITSAHNILGAIESSERCAWVPVYKWNQRGDYSRMGTILIGTHKVDVVKEQEGKNTVQEYEAQQVIERLPAEERMRLRVGLFKGDHQLKHQAVTYLKKREHSSYINQVVSTQLKADGQLTYQLARSTHYLFAFQNNTDSQLNTFTFHLSSPYAELVIDEKEYRETIDVMIGFERAGWGQLRHLEPGVYEGKLRLGQEIGLLIRVKVGQYCQTPLKKVQLIVRRNTIQVRSYLLKCIYKEPLVYDFMRSYLLLPSSEDLKSQLSPQLLLNYRDLTILNRYIDYNPKSKSVVISSSAGVKEGDTVKLMITGHPVGDNQSVIIVYELTVVRGVTLTLMAGEKGKVKVPAVGDNRALILRNYDQEVTILNYLKFVNSDLLPQTSSVDLYVHPLRPYPSKDYYISRWDLSGKQLPGFILRISSKLSELVTPLRILFETNSTYSFVCNNPYACSGIFKLISSSSNCELEDKQVKIQGYGTRVVLFKLAQWLEHHIYIYLIDKRDQVCQVIDVTCQIPELPLEQA